MTDAVEVLHAVERLQAIARGNPALDPGALAEATDILQRLGLHAGTTGYKAEKLAETFSGFQAWSAAPAACRVPLLHAIEHLRHALARRSEGQD